MTADKTQGEGPTEIEKSVEAELLKWVKEEPHKLMMFMLIQMGKMVIETNAGSLDLKQESTFNKQRYEIKAKITVKKIKTKLNSK